jgi:hypothetical protein
LEFSSRADAAQPSGKDVLLAQGAPQHIGFGTTAKTNIRDPKHLRGA